MWNHEIFGDLFGKILKKYRKLKGFSQEELAHNSGLDRTYISLLERGKKSPTLKTLFNICCALEISLKTLISDFSDLLNVDEGPNEERELKFSPLLPYFEDYIQCGPGDMAKLDQAKKVSLEELFIKGLSSPYLLKTLGDSMKPFIFEGDLLLIDSKQRPKNSSIILAQLNSEYMIKRFYKYQENIILKSDNEAFQDILIREEDDFSVCGVVKEIIRQAS